MAGLSGCHFLQFEAPSESYSLQSPPTWQASGKGSQGKISQGWLSEFSDRGMKAAVNRAMTHNQDLAAAAARMREAVKVGRQSVIITDGEDAGVAPTTAVPEKDNGLVDPPEPAGLGYVSPGRSQA